MSDQEKNLEPPQDQPDQEQSLLQQALDNRQVFDSEIQQQIQKDAFALKMESNIKEEELGMMKRDIIKRRKKREKKEKLISARRLKRLLKKKPVDKIRLVYQAYFFLVSIAVLTLSILSYRDQTVYEGDYQQFVDNVKSYVIDDIQFTYTNKNCKTQFGSQYSSLYEYNWPGTKIGCDCSKGFNFSSLTDYNIDAFFSESFMLGRICSQDLLSKNCNTVNEQQPKTFNSWNDGSYGRRIVMLQFYQPLSCVPEEKLELIYNLTQQIVNLITKSVEQVIIHFVSPPIPVVLYQKLDLLPIQIIKIYHQKIIQVQETFLIWDQDSIFIISKTLQVYQLQNLELLKVTKYVLSHQNTQKILNLIIKLNICQYYYLQLLKYFSLSIYFMLCQFNLIQVQLGNFIQNYKEIKLANLLKMIISTQILSDIKCFCKFNIIFGVDNRRNLDQNISPNRIDYPLMVSMRRQCENTDQLFQVIHSIDEEQFYLSNNVIYLSEKLPYFNIDTKYNWTLHAKTFIPWAPQCRGELFDQVLQEGATLHHVYTSLRVQLGVTIAYFIVIGLIFNIVGTMTACNFAWSCMATKPESQYNYIFLMEIGFKILLQIAEIIVIIVSFVIIDDKRKIIKQINDDGCVSDPVSGYFFTNLESDLTKFAWSYNLANLVIFAVTLYWITQRYLVIKGKQSYENKQIIKAIRTLILDLIIIKHSINQGHHHGAKKHHEKGEHQELDIGSHGESGNQQEIKSDVKLQAKTEPQV